MALRACVACDAGVCSVYALQSAGVCTVHVCALRELHQVAATLPGAPACVCALFAGSTAEAGV